MSEKNFQQEFDQLIEKYAELLTGQTSPDIIEKLKVYAIYSHISKTMPPLAQHWNQSHPGAKQEMMELFQFVKKLNEEHRANQRK